VVGGGGGGAVAAVAGYGGGGGGVYGGGPRWPQPLNEFRPDIPAVPLDRVLNSGLS